MTFDEILGRLPGEKRKKLPRGWQTLCPAHEDREPSLSVERGEDGRTVLHCHAGCEPGKVLDAVGLKLADLFPDDGKPEERPKVQKRRVCEYVYRDEHGQPIGRKVRWEPKTFTWEQFTNGQWRPGKPARKTPYRLDELVKAPVGVPVWICEGEKDADNVRAAGALAVTSSKDWQAAWGSLFRGRRVIIVRDNDDAGSKISDEVAATLSGAASVTIVVPPGVVDKGDVSDYLDAGGTLAALEELATRRLDAFCPSRIRASGERQQRLETAPRVISFGSPYLDDALTGILPRDVVIATARTGAGKTEFAVQTALSVGASGKRVHVFALEAEPGEIERRIKWRYVSQLHYARPHAESIRYQDWHAGLIDHIVGDIEDEAHDMFLRATENLSTFYRGSQFTGDSFVREMSRIASETDFVVFDHLHYVDMDDDNENRGYKALTKQFRDAALLNDKGVLAIAHLRKTARFDQRLLPMDEDIHGSSDIIKIATKIIGIAKAEDVEPMTDDRGRPVPWMHPTYMGVLKNRTDGGTTRYGALTWYDSRTNAYSQQYELFRPVDGGKSAQWLTMDEMPSWAKRVSAPRSSSRAAEPFDEGVFGGY